MALPTLLDDRSVPDFRDAYLAALAGAAEVAVAISRIRLGGLQVDASELLAPRRIRVVVMELSGITLAMEAERLAEEARGRQRVRVLVSLLEEGRLQLRSAPLGGWAPDFSVFLPSPSLEPTAAEGGETLLVGPHWMDRPYPHRGPALTSIHRGPGVRQVFRRFEELWAGAHDVSGPVRSTLAQALERCAPVQAAAPPGG